MHEPHMYTASGMMESSSFDNSELLSSPVLQPSLYAEAERGAHEPPIQFPTSELLGTASSGSDLLGSSMLSGSPEQQSAEMQMGTRETFINDLLR